MHEPPEDSRFDSDTIGGKPFDMGRKGVTQREAAAYHAGFVAGLKEMARFWMGATICMSVLAGTAIVLVLVR